MRNFATALSAVITLATIAAAEEPRWIIALSAIRRLQAAGEPAGRFFAGSANFILNSSKGADGFPRDYRAMPAATFPSYAALRDALDGGRLPPEVKAVVYDNEAWQFTPPEEQHDIPRFEKLAAEVIHRRGLLFIAAPAVDLTRVLGRGVSPGRYDEYLRLGIARDAAYYADVYEIQAQGSLGNLELYARFVKAAASKREPSIRRSPSSPA
jgi:hypothetical protein